MSKVYSFRLDKNNPREAQAREVIEAWISKGYSLRHIIVEALIHLNLKNISNEEMDNLVNELRRLIKRPQKDQKTITTEDISLSKLFTEAIGQSVKPGIRSK